MTNNFTTPEFAKVLKEHGIEIDTPFYWKPEKGSRHEGYYLCAKDGFTYGLTCALLSVEVNITTDISPAYPLTEVLGWLPKGLHGHDGYYYQLELFISIEGTLGGTYSDSDMGTMFHYETQTRVEADSLEKLFELLLTEGWITKETILQAIKNNAK